jgi:hypothetical protein
VDSCVHVRFDDHTELCSNKKLMNEPTWPKFFAGLEVGACRWRMLLDLDEKKEAVGQIWYFCIKP